MEVTFSEGGRYKFACYRLTYEESKSPDRIAKIKADLASKGKDGYSIAITYDVSPTPPTWDTFANSLLCLDGRLEMWKLMQESWPHHKAVEAQKGVSKMSTSYFIFTEVLANDQWHCINPQVMKLLPIEHLILVPTLRSDSRYQFEKAYRQLECDGHPFTVDEMSRNLQASVNDWLTPEDSVRIAVCYDDILKLLNTSGKEHSAFALRSEVAAFQNDESDNILDFVSIDEYRKMEDELKKAYQYFESVPSDKWFWNAYDRMDSVPDGTYEAIGPHFRANPYNLDADVLKPHGKDIVELDRSFEGIRTYLETHVIEGIVFWKDGQPQCKIKRKDFGFPWGR